MKPLSPSTARQQQQLRKSLTLWDGFNLVVGSIIGSGIFASPGVVFKHTGSGGASLLVWAFAGLIALCGAVSYVELALALPSAGGEVTYMTRFFGKTAGFLFTWANATVSRPAAFAITSIVCGQYLCRLAYGDVAECKDGSSTTVMIISFLAAGLVFAVNVLSSNATTITLRTSTTTSVFALGVAVLIGLLHALEVKTLGSRIGFAGTSTNILDWSPAFLAALWAYDGWNTLNYASEELASADDFLRIIKLSIPFVTGLFVFVNAAYLIALPENVVAHSETIGVDLATTAFGRVGASVMPLFVATSAFGSAVGNMFGGARLVFSSARDGTLPEYLADLSPRSALPVKAVFCQTVLGCGFLLVGNFEELVSMFSCATWGFYFVTVAGLIRARVMEPDMPRPYKVPLIAPVIFSIASLLLILIEFVSKPKSSITAFVFILLGIPFFRLQKFSVFRQMCCFRKRGDQVFDLETEEQEQVTYRTFH